MVRRREHASSFRICHPRHLLFAPTAAEEATLQEKTLAGESRHTLGARDVTSTPDRFRRCVVSTGFCLFHRMQNTASGHGSW